MRIPSSGVETNSKRVLVFEPFNDCRYSRFTRHGVKVWQILKHVRGEFSIQKFFPELRLCFEVLSKVEESQLDDARCGLEAGHTVKNELARAATLPKGLYKKLRIYTSKT